jgi:hypothetical protein
MMLQMQGAIARVQLAWTQEQVCSTPAAERTHSQLVHCVQSAELASSGSTFMGAGTHTVSKARALWQRCVLAQSSQHAACLPVCLLTCLLHAVLCAVCLQPRDAA